MPLVIDLSHWNDVVSFETVARSGVVGVIHKATESTNYFDPTYAGRRAAAADAGLAWGAYHFIRPGSPGEQADWFLDNARPDGNTLLACDFEDDAVSLNDVKTFLSIVRDLTGRSPVLYSGSSIKACLGNDRDAELAAYRLWLAQYTSGEPSWPSATWPDWWLWQYTDSGTVAGINGNVDLDRYNGSRGRLLAEWAGSPSDREPDATVTIAIEVPEGVAVVIAVNGQRIEL